MNALTIETSTIIKGITRKVTVTRSRRLPMTKITGVTHEDGGVEAIAEGIRIQVTNLIGELPRWRWTVEVEPVLNYSLSAMETKFLVAVASSAIVVLEGQAGHQG